MRRLLALLQVGTVIGGVLLLSGCGTTALRAHQAHDLPSFHQVDEGFYRGGQPSRAGVEQVRRMGIKTIISLRQPSRATEEERRLAEQLGMRWVNIPMWFWWRPTDQQVRQFLSIAGDPAQRPVFLHCRQGWNRVGIMTAIYRVVRQGWKPQQAYIEARRLGLVPWNLLSRYVVLYKAPREYAASSPSP
jgi:protein tyrosine/serine phosphatase